MNFKDENIFYGSSFLNSEYISALSIEIMFFILALITE